MIESLARVTQFRLINLRWLSTLSMAMAALVSPNILGTAELLPRLLAFSTVVASANACLLVAAMLHGGGGEDGVPLLSPWVQLSIDLCLWSIFVFLSGGATNPLISVLLPLVAIGAMVLDRGRAWLFGLMAILVYSFLWRFHVPLAINDAQRATYLHLLGMWLVFVVSTIVSIWFIQKMREAVRVRDARLADAREKVLRNDWLASLGMVAAGTAHELGTPIATMNVLIDDWSEDACFPEAYRDDLVIMRKQIDRCRTTLNQLANRALPDSRVQTMAISDWLRGLLEAWQGIHPAVDVALVMSPGARALSVARDAAVERSLSNVLDNAQQAAATRISVTVDAHVDGVLVSVVDNGCGVSEAAVHAIARGQPVVSEKGLGIGLAIGKASIERAGGAFSIEPLRPQGTKVSIVLPLIEQERAS